jgi:hypothetical protein
MVRKATDRRGFIATITQWALAGAAFLGIPGCDVNQNGEEDDFAMHGPIRVAHDLLMIPAATEANQLFRPFDTGKPFLAQWAIAHVARGQRDQLLILVVDIETGGHAEIEIYAFDDAMNPIAHSEKYALFIDNGGHGDKLTPFHLRKLCARLGEILNDNEHGSELSWQMPTHAEAIEIATSREQAARPQPFILDPVEKEQMLGPPEV